jgi:hypothetical protein
VRGLQRSLLPGRAEVTLAAGRSTVYVEHRSVVDGKPIEIADANATCTLTDAQGTELPMLSAAGRTRYAFGDYAGRRIADVAIPAPGTFTLACTGTGVVAIGGGLGAWFVVALVGGLLPGLAGLALLSI